MHGLSACRLPMVDLAGLRTADPNALQSIANVVRDACRSSGIFYITNCGVPSKLQRRVLNEAARLFNLSKYEKDSLDIRKSDYMRGYFGYGADKSDGINGDIKEGYDLGLDLPLTDALVRANLPFYGPNVWPPSLPSFKRNITRYYSRMSNLGLDLLRAFSISLGLAENYFSKYFIKPIAQLRLLRYPPSVSENLHHVGAGEHTDFGCITIILQDNVGGLEIKDIDGNWISVPAIPDAFVVMIGDLMQRWTNDEYPATVHRVLNNADAARHSVAFFMDPDYHTKIDCLSSCASQDRPSRYEPIVVGNYMSGRFLQTTTFAQKHSVA